jgi:hypothetical protein
MIVMQYFSLSLIILSIQRCNFLFFLTIYKKILYVYNYVTQASMRSIENIEIISPYGDAILK